jgi:enterochelin esterase-like enzyme
MKRSVAAIILAVAIAALLPAARATRAQESIISPRLAALQKEMETGSKTALEQFWQEVAKQGTPLVEPIKGDDRYLLVTFLWRGSAETKNVVVFSELGGFEDISKNVMTNLPGTDLWHKTYRARNDARFTYHLSLNDSLLPIKEIKDWLKRTSTWQTDPLNPRRSMTPIKMASTVELPQALPQPWITRQPGVAAGRQENKKLKSKILNNERDIYVYTPAGYRPDGEPHGLLVLFDGVFYTLFIPTPTILDNMISKGSIPPLVAVVINTLFDRVRELSCNPSFNEFLAKELIPWIRQNYNVTSDPRQTIVGGASLAGLAAVFAGLQHPEIFGNVLSQSGSFWWKPKDDAESEWLAKQFVKSPKLPIRFYLDVGLLEVGPIPDDGPSMVVVNRHMRDVLQAKGYSVYYKEFYGGHEFFNWRGTLSDGLLALIGKDK